MSAPTEEAGDVVVTRSEERLNVDTVRVPVRRAVIRKVIVSEERTVTVTVRREELRIEYVDVAPSAGAESSTAPAVPLDLVLHEERITVGTAVVPVERVHVDVERVAGERRITGSVRLERIEVDGEALPPGDEGGGRHRAD